VHHTQMVHRRPGDTEQYHIRKKKLSQNFLIPVRRFIVFRRVCGELLCKGRHWVVTWRITALGWISGMGDSRGVACLGVVKLTERLVTAWD